MRINCRCEHCNKKLRATEDMLGKKAKCPECGAVTTLRAAEAPAMAMNAAPIQMSLSPAEARGAGQKQEGISEAPPFDEAAFDEVVEDHPDLPPVKKAPRGAAPFSQILLRVAVLLCGIAGAMAMGLLGYLWMTHLSMATAVASDPLLAPQLAGNSTAAIRFRKAMELLQAQGFVANLLFAGAAVSLIGGFLGFFRQGLIGGILMLGGVIGPAVMNSATLLLVGFPVVGGLLCFFIRSRKAAQAAADRREATGLPPAKRGMLSVVGAVFFFLILAGYAGMVSLALGTALGASKALEVTFNNIKTRLRAIAPQPQGNPGGKVPPGNVVPR